MIEVVLVVVATLWLTFRVVPAMPGVLWGPPSFWVLASSLLALFVVRELIALRAVGPHSYCFRDARSATDIWNCSRRLADYLFHRVF